MQVGIIGAGAAASAAVHVLDGATDAELTVFEKSGGLCGRAAARRRGPITYEYGANYLKDTDERVAELVTETLDTDGLVTVEGGIQVFDETGEVSAGRESTTQKWTYRDGITQLAKRLLGRSDATVHRRTRVEHVARENGDWWLTDDDGTDRGPFDVLLCNPPAPQTADLLADADWDTETRADLVTATEAVEYRAVWTAVLGYENRLDVPYYALVNPGKDHEIGWISREECKPGHVPEGQSVLIVQANHDWTVDHYDAPAEDNVAELAAMTAEIVGEDWLADTDWTDHQGWRYALVQESADRGPLQAAETAGLYCLGDWVAGEARLHAALRNGLAVGERVALAD